MNRGDAALAAARTVLRFSPSALITDVDGTISPIVSRPQDARVSRSITSSLERLARDLALVAVVTAREADVARRMVGARGLTYVGNYGLDGGSNDAFSSDLFHRAIVTLQPFLDRESCVMLEDKGAGLAIHYRSCADRESVRGELLRLCRAIAAEDGLRIQEGKQVVELVPARLPDKGTAVATLLGEKGIGGAVYLGDDLSDITVFQELARRRQAKGVPSCSIAVVDAETDSRVTKAADEVLMGVAEVEEFLGRLTAALVSPEGAL